MGSALIPGDLVKFELGRTDAHSLAETWRSPEFTGNPLGGALRLVNGVGIATKDDFGADFITAYFLAVYASHPPVTRRMATLATGLPATALTGPDLHRLDSTDRFH